MDKTPNFELAKQLLDEGKLRILADGMVLLSRDVVGVHVDRSGLYPGDKGFSILYRHDIKAWVGGEVKMQELRDHAAGLQSQEPSR